MSTFAAQIEAALVKTLEHLFSEESVCEGKSPRIDKVSWTWHPHHGISVVDGYHQHDTIKAERPELYDHPDDPSRGWNPPAGFAKVHHGKREIEFHDYESGKPHPQAGEAFKHELGLKQYRIVPATHKTAQERKDEDWI